MIRVRLFGVPRVERGSRPITGRAAQRHPLALLALLAVAPRSAASRDRLVAHLWPDHDTARARHRLSVALHVLRKELGHNALRSHGDTVRLNTDVVWTDVGAFTGLVADGRMDEAARLYAGPLLDGFFLRGVPEFDAWLDRERARLASLYGETLERLAREAESRDDRQAAHGLWTRLGAHAPYDGRVALEVVRGLERVGDRIGALRRARAHAALVTAELGAAPDPALVHAAERLASALDTADDPEAATGAVPPPPAGRPRRGAPGPRRRTAVRRVAGGAAVVTGAGVLLAAALTANRRWPNAPPPPAAPVRLAATPFEAADGGGTRSELGALLVRDVLAALAPVPGLDLRPGETPDAALDGLIAAEPGRVVVTAWLTDPVTGRLRWSRRYEAADGDPVAARQELSLRVAVDLRAHLAPFAPGRYTADPAAYGRLLEGLYVQRKASPEALGNALRLYREALERDSAFALAHAASADAYMALARQGEDPASAYGHARRHVRRALALDPTLAEGLEARARIGIWWDHDFDAAFDALRHALVLHPTLPQAHGTYGDYLLYARARPDAAVRAYRRALDLDPLSAPRSAALERALHLAGRYREALEQNRATRALLSPAEAAAHASATADALRALGRLDAAIAAYRARGEAAGAPAPGLVIALVEAGRRQEAEELIPAVEAGAEASGSGWESVAAAHAALGDPDRAVRWLERARDARSPSIISLGVDPDFTPLRADPRFGALLRQIGVPD